MNVGLDEARGIRRPARSSLAVLGRKGRLDCGDAAALDTDIGRAALIADHAGIAQDEVHGRWLLSAQLSRVSQRDQRFGSTLPGEIALETGRYPNLSGEFR